ncbi:MAG TPA: adenylate/guanylate cyclase domain-containing protein [Solirubrobacteraceae bacterium]|nr:adenylate/guanylate cyclase domain-containing protein [Solirubrobacteraceae bacterium]
MVCPACKAEIGDSAKFCTECGTPLTLRCPSCGAQHLPEQKFCGECGAALAGAAAAAAAPAGTPRAPSPSPPPGPAPGAPGGPAVPSTVAELRLVAVLFVDLVGYTSLSESREPEDMRELLGRYFESARTIVDRYGGTLEKFIGDAVMSVWGVPVAREDDAERAVRAGLEMVDAVKVFGEEVGAPQLRARAGVVTGQVAATVSPGEGLVVGDRVNTASRVQSAARPGTLFVDEVTREVTSAAIAYEDMGEHDVKGKAEPLRLWRAVRVIAGVGGTQRESGLEAPLVGRDADLRLLKELFHGALERRTARLVAVSGVAGVGKTRLRWEFDNYADGLAEMILWHSGRCLSYGDGVAYWALAEMVRQRLGIAEEASVEDAAAKLASGLDRWVPDHADREFLEPRLGALLGVAEPGLGRADLFAGWRMFLERLAEHLPVVLVFEDLQWADEGLLDFIEHLLDWSAASPIFILALARPEYTSGREGWPGARRGTTLLELEPLDDDVMGTLLDELVEGLPRRARRQIIKRAEGVPLYAIETIRALANRGVLSERDGRLTASGELGDLDVPASLSSLLAARLDALEPAERGLVKAMSVLGGAFPRYSAAALGGLPDDQLDAVLAALVRKQVLRIRADPLSPDRGQYAFVQSLLRTVAYEMLSRRERKPRHRAAAEHLRSVFPNDGEEIAEAIASHYLNAYRAARGDADVDELRIETIAALRRAAQRAAAVGAPDSAERHYRTAIELASEQDERTQLTRAAGQMALHAGRLEAALELFDSVVVAQLEAGREHEAARIAGQIGRALSRLGRNEEAIERIEPALRTLGADELDAEVAALHAVLGHALLFAGRYEQAEPPLETALRIARELELPAVLSGALIDKGLICLQRSRPEEARGFLDAALAIAERNDLPAELMLARGNSGSLGMQWDLPEAAEHYAAALALARRHGERFLESVAAGNLAYLYVVAGRWEEVRHLTAELLEDFGDRPGAEFLHSPLAIVHTLRGELEAAHASFASMTGWEQGDDDELRAIHSSVAVGVRLAEGRAAEALASGIALLAPAIDTLGISHDAVRNAWPDTLAAALELGRLDAAAQLLELLGEQPPGHIPPYLRAQLLRGGALTAAAEGELRAVERDLGRAIEGFRALRYPYWLARAQTDLAAWLIEQDRRGEAAPLLGEATATLESLGATPALARARELARGSSSQPAALG